MRQFRKTVIALVSGLMVLGTMGVAGASSGSGHPAPCATREQFVYDFDVAAGITPVYPPLPDFSDVPSSSPFYGYIEAAVKGGIINGVGYGLFDPMGCLTRAQIAKIEVIALGDNAAALSYMDQATNFTDDSSIPFWARGYVVEAVALGLVHGYPDGSYAPNASMTSSDESFFLAQYRSVAGQGALTLSASSRDVGVGQQVILSSTGTTLPVTYTVNSMSALISGSIFVASQPGDYTVTGETATGLKATVVIAVYGLPNNLVINVPSTSVVANGLAKTTVTVDVMDALGNIDANSSDKITLSSSNPAVVGIFDGTSAVAGPLTATAVNGVATFTLESGTIPGATATLTATDTSESLARSSYTASVSTTEQVATSLKVLAPSYIEANNASGSEEVQVEVDDQTGNPMQSGVWGVNLSLTGPAEFPDGTNGPESGAYFNGHDATFSFDAIQGETGTITFTATGLGLSSGFGTTTAVITGEPQALTLQAGSGGTSFTEGPAANNSVALTLGTVDAHGYPTGTPGTVDMMVTAEGSASGDIGVSTDGIHFKSAMSGAAVTPGPDGTIYLADLSATPGPSDNPDAGSYMVTVTDASSSDLAASHPVSLQETAASAYQIAINPTDVVIPASDPQTTFTAQIQDQYGNDLPDGGLTLNARATGDYAFSLNGTEATFSGGAYQVSIDGDTAAGGSVAFRLSAPPYTGHGYTIQVFGGGLQPSVPGLALVESTVASTLSVQTLDLSTGSSYYATAGDVVQVTATAKDLYGTPQNLNPITFTASGTGLCANSNPTSDNCTVTQSATTNGNGEATVSFNAVSAGVVTVTASDSVSVDQPQGEAALEVSAGPVTGFDLFDASGNNLSLTAGGFTAGHPVELWLKPVDAYGNPTVADQGYYVALDQKLGEWRSSSGGSDLSHVWMNAGAVEESLSLVPSSTTTTLIPGAFGLTESWDNAGTTGTFTLTTGGTKTTWKITDLSGGTASFSSSSTLDSVANKLRVEKIYISNPHPTYDLTLTRGDDTLVIHYSS